MREAAVVGEAEGASGESGDDVEVGGFGGQRKGKRGIGGFAVESGAAQVGAEEEMGCGFQIESLSREVSLRFASCYYGNYNRFSNPGRDANSGGTSRVSAAGTTEISAGSWPRSSPSASM